MAGESKPIRGLCCGFYEIDQLTTGFYPGDLVAVGGRPSVGKTSLVYDFALNIGRELQGRGNGVVALFALETVAEQVVRRLVSMLAGVAMDAAVASNGALGERQYEALADACERLYEMPLLVDDRSSLTPTQILEACRLTQSERTLSAVVVDSLHLMEPDVRRENRTQEISEITRAMKALAKDLRVPVFVTCELSRIADHRDSEAPRLSDLRDSGTIEAVADIVMLLHRGADNSYAREEIKARNYEVVVEAHVDIAKQRQHRPGSVVLGFQPCFTRYRNLTR